MKTRRPQKAWNAGKVIGAMRPFTAEQVDTICRLLRSDDTDTARRDLALFRVGLDAMLRASDLLSLTVAQVVDRDGSVLEVIETRQRKTGRPVSCILTAPTRKALAAWLAISGVTGIVFAVGYRQYTRIVKQLAVSVRLDPKLYSTHSIRRTKAAIVYAKTRNVEIVRQMLGQASIGATSAYLGIEKAEVLAVAREVVL